MSNRLLEAARAIGNKRRASILLGAFAWVFVTGVIGGASTIAFLYASTDVQIWLFGVWLGFSAIVTLAITITSARMAASKPESELEQVMQAIRGAGDHGIRPALLVDRLGIDRVNIDRLLAILYDDGRIETYTNGERQVLYHVRQ